MDAPRSTPPSRHGRGWWRLNDSEVASRSEPASSSPSAPPAIQFRIDWFVALACLLATLGIGLVSDALLPPLRSRDGRLVQQPFDGGLLALANQRLDLPAGRSWKRFDAWIEVEKDEALSFVVDRRGDDFDVVRLSRAAELPSGSFEMRAGAIVSRNPLEFPDVSARRRLIVDHTASEIRAFVDGLEVAKLPVTDPGDLEIVMYPPWCTRLPHRVSLGEVLLDDGTQLLPTTTLARRAANLPFLHAALALLVALPFARGKKPWLARIFPGHARWRPTHLTVMLAWLTAIEIAGALFFGHWGYFAPIGPTRQTSLRVMAVALVILSMLLFRIRDALVSRFPRVREAFLMKAPWIPLTHLLGLIALLGVIGGVLGRNMHDADLPQEAASPEARFRVACYGGSSTRGHPFDVDWPFTFPRQLEGDLRRTADPAATVWNMGISSARITDINARLLADLAKLAPAQVVLYSVGNDVPMDPKDFRHEVEWFLDRVTPVAPVLLVEEQDFDIVYDWYSAAQIPPHYGVLRDIACERGISFLDPTEEMKAHRDEFLSLDQDGHLTKYGYAIIARRMAERLVTPTPLCPKPSS